MKIHAPRSTLHSPVLSVRIAAAAAVLGAGLGFLTAARAVPLHVYTFADVTTSSGRTSAGAAAGHLTFSDFAAADTLSANSNTAGVFAFGSWVSGGAINGSDVFSGGINPAEFFEFTVSPDAGYAYTLTAIEFAAGRTSTGPRQFVVRSDADAFAANLAASAAAPLSIVGSNLFQLNDNTVTSLVAGELVALSGPDFSTLTGPRTFRLYAFNAEGSGQFRVDDVAIHGSVAAVAVSVPEDLSVPVVLCALLILAVSAGRGRRARFAA